MIGTNVYLFNNVYYIKSQHREQIIRAENRTQMLYWLLMFGFEQQELENAVLTMEENRDNFMNFGAFNNGFIFSSRKSDEDITKEIGLVH